MANLSRKKMINDQNKFPYKELGKQLKVLRGSKKQKEFAKELGVALGTYNRYEKGRRKVSDGLFRLAEILAQRTNEKIDAVREARGLYAISQELEIDGKKHTFKIHSPGGEAQKLPQPDSAVQNALKMIEKYVEDLRRREVENAELKAHVALLEKEFSDLKKALDPDALAAATTKHKAT